MPEKLTTTEFNKLDAYTKFPESRPGVILEIGPRMNTADAIFKDVKKKIEQGAVYVALDSKAENLRETKSEGKTNLILGDLRDLPFSDSSINEIWLINVFGLIEKKPKLDKDGKPLQRNIGGSIYPGIKDYVRELARVLKPGGKIVVGEYFTPRSHDPQILLKTNFGEYGLTAKIHLAGEDLDEYLQGLGASPAMKRFIASRMDSYFIELNSD